METPEKKMDVGRRRVYLIDQGYQMGEVNATLGVFIIMVILQAALFVAIGWLHLNYGLDKSTALVAFVAIAFAVPMLICMCYAWLTIRRTHRVAGAAFRLVQDINNLVTNPSFRFHLRDGDYLTEIASQLNLAMECLEARNTGLKEVAEYLDEAYLKIVKLEGNLSEEELEKLRLSLERATHSLGIAWHGISCSNLKSETASASAEEKANEGQDE